MSLALSGPRYTIEEYLALERAAEERHEYLDGYIYAMAGESPEHADICTNLVGELSRQLRGTPCRVRSKDTKVLSGPPARDRRATKGLFSYPDIVVICGDPRYHDQSRDVVLNPSTIVEVMSKSTEAFDRGQKFLRYQNWNSTLTDYLLVSQFEPIVEQYVRRPDARWTYEVFRGVEQTVQIESIACKLRLADVYDRIIFPTAEEADEPSEE
ncbi:MAG TPA: Uma2 family endonuclease [Blastocatellia bacterium]|jgi:Uma2 family endonuclease|nr:Uma2 family endonuclease [Blastocatellia bacterium]